MKNIYYQLWVDAIVNSKNYKDKESGWKFDSLLIITAVNGFNFLFVKMWLGYLNIYQFEFFFDFAGNSFILGLIEAFLNFFAPIGFIHYLIIFHNNRYEKLIVKYSDYNGKLVMFYGLVSIFLLLITIVYQW